MLKWYIGIDPGQKGGIALISDTPQAIEYAPMPDTVKGIIETLGLYRDCAHMNSAVVAVIVERAQSMPGMGVSGAFSYGRHFGGFEVACAFVALPYHEVRPHIWKKALGLNSEKTNAIQECERLFPDVNLIPGKKRTPHDGIAESLLIAEWGRRQNL